MSRLTRPRPQTPPADTARQRRSWLTAAAPSVLVVLPLLGMSLKSDERLHLFQQISFTDVNLFGIGRYVEERLGNFLDIGNFRPIGRFTEVLVHGVVFETAEATGLGPHTVLGVVRLLVVALLAVLAAKMVSALTRSAGVDADRSLVSLYPLVMGTVVVANGIIGGLAQFPHTFIGSVVLIQAAALAVARDRDLQPRPLRWHEYAAMALFGAVFVMFYDVAYLAPIVAAAFLVARVALARLAPRAALATAAVRRWAAFSAGFAAVFVPVRIDIARRCAQNACYRASDLSISPDAFGTALPRLATGLPPVGWDYNADLARLFDVDTGLWELPKNSLLAVMLIGIVALAVAALARGWRPGLDASSAPVAPRRASHARLAIVLVGLGALMAILSALLSGLSASMQQRDLPIGEAWREAQLAQLAWSLVIVGCLVALDLAARSEGARRGLRTAAAAVLAVGLALTLLANWRFAEVDRRDPTAALTSLIATSTIHIDDSETGDSLRCLLSGGYRQVTPEKVWITGWRMRNELDRFMGNRHDLPYCYPSTMDTE
ncbi:MAG: hypothetical protein OXH86_06415 [Acidimicrobiaceae bacterium]|nr:hypothetical protein [Acidimicrobiaceae bacterium]